MPPREGIQTEDTSRDPNEGLSQTTIQGGMPASRPATQSGVQTIQRDASGGATGSTFDPVVQPIAQVDKTVAEPVKAIEPIQPIQGPRTAEVPDFTAVSQKAKADAEKAKASAQADTDKLIQEQRTGTEAIQTKLAEDTEKLKAKASEETEKQIARNEVIKGKLNQEALEVMGTQSRNIQNSFSQQFAAGKDNGFINAANVTAVRTANKQYSDYSLQLDLQFMQDSNNIYNREFNTLSRLSENLVSQTTQMDVEALGFSTGLKQSLNTFKQGIDQNLSQTELTRMENDIKYQFEAQQEIDNEWNTSAKGFVDSLLSTGNIDEALEMSKEFASVSDHPYFKMLQNPAVITSLQENQDATMVANWNTARERLNAIAISASSMDPVMQEEAMREMLDIMKQNPARGATFALSHFSNINEDEYEGLGIDEADAQVIDDFVNGRRDASDSAVQEIFASSYIKDSRIEADKANAEAVLTAAQIPQFIQQSPVGNEIVEEWLLDGSTGTHMNIDVDESNVFGEAGIAKINFFGRENVDVSQMGGLAGIDISFQGFTGDQGTDGWEPDVFNDKNPQKDAGGKEIVIGGQTYTQEQLTDSYLSYYKDFAKKWNQATTEERVILAGPNNENPKNRDAWANELRSQNKATGSKSNLSDFSKNLTSNKNVIETDKGIVTLTGDLANMDPKYKELFGDIAKGTNISSLDFRDFSDLMSQPGVASEFRDLNKDNSLFVDVPTAVNTDTLQRGVFITQAGHPFSKDNIESTLGDLKTSVNEDGTLGGTIMYNGAPTKVVVSAGRYKKSAGSTTWHPTYDIQLISTDGTTQTLKTKMPGSLIATDKGSVLARAKENFEATFKGGQ